MKNYSYLLLLSVCSLMFCCESENIEDKYYQTTTIDDTLNNPVIPHPSGEIAWYPLNGNLNDSSGNNIPLVFIGDTNYVEGMNDDYGMGIHLDGVSYLLINLGYYDTLSIIFWIKGDQEISALNKPVLFDYGLNAISSKLDGSSGATSLQVKKNEDSASSEDASVEYLNSFNQYSFFYFEAGGDLTRVYFKGYASTGGEVIYSEDLSFPGSIDPLSEILYIGRSSLRDNQSESYFRGAIDEIHIYSKPLTNLEIESFAFLHTN